MKTVDGIELLQMIKDGKVKADTEIKVWYDDGIREYMTTLYFNGLDLKWQPNTFLARHFYNKYVEFEILEEEKEIEEITIRDNTLGFPNGEWTARNMDKAFAIKINELVREVRKLKKEGK